MIKEHMFNIHVNWASQRSKIFCL